MLDPVVVIGIGEMGGVFTRGLLRLGHPVFPVTRNTDMEQLAKAITAPELVLVAVGENDLHPSSASPSHGATVWPCCRTSCCRAIGRPTISRGLA